MLNSILVCMNCFMLDEQCECECEGNKHEKTNHQAAIAVRRPTASQNIVDSCEALFEMLGRVAS